MPYARQIETIKKRRAAIQSVDGYRRRGSLQSTAVKIILDGVCENLTGALKRSYWGHDHEHGLLTCGAEELNEIVSGLEANDGVSSSIKAGQSADFAILDRDPTHSRSLPTT